MFEGVHLTEEESEHIKAWRCKECTAAMMEVVMMHPNSPWQKS
jgi:hypothetical protein